MQHRRVQVVDVHAVLNGCEAELVCLPERLAPLDSAAGEPAAKRVLVMIAAGVCRFAFSVHALAQWSAAKLRSPYHECVVQHTELLEVLHERRHRAIDVAALS